MRAFSPHRLLALVPRPSARPPPGRRRAAPRFGFRCWGNTRPPRDCGKIGVLHFFYYARDDVGASRAIPSPQRSKKRSGLAARSLGPGVGICVNGQLPPPPHVTMSHTLQVLQMIATSTSSSSSWEGNRRRFRWPRLRGVFILAFIACHGDDSCTHNSSGRSLRS